MWTYLADYGLCYGCKVTQKWRHEKGQLILAVLDSCHIACIYYISIPLVIFIFCNRLLSTS
jgi:hypothetical protein